MVAGDGAEGDNFGSTVAVDGDVMVVAAPWADVGGVETSGAVYVFLRDPASGSGSSTSTCCQPTAISATAFSSSP